MVISKLYGGLGNQMYQFAAGKALAERLGTRFYMDLSWFEEVKKDPELTQRVYELDGFDIQPNTKINIKDKLSLKLNPARTFKEEDFGYLKDFEKLSGNVILDGYWQSYKYFEKNNENIVNAFKFPSKIRPENKKLINHMKSTNSIALHVRRGDYNTKRGKQFHGLMPTSYYNKAVAGIEKKVENPTLFVFSDELSWCKKNLRFNHPTVFIDSNSPNSGPEDMQLMASCKHIVTANSSFSWWSAWLNQNPEKIVYAPIAWFKGAEHEIEDRLPVGWIRI